MARSCPENKAFLLVVKPAYDVTCLETTSRRSGKSEAVGNIALVVGRNTKSTAEAAEAAETAFAGPYSFLGKPDAHKQ